MTQKFTAEEVLSAMDEAVYALGFLPGGDAILAKDRLQKARSDYADALSKPTDSGRAMEALRTIKYSIQQARILGNDWKRELALIENTVDAALAAQPKPADIGLVSSASNVLAADSWWKCNSDSPKSALNHYEEACADLRSAMRYRNEQSRCGCTYMCKFCRDEQEKQA